MANGEHKKPSSRMLGSLRTSAAGVHAARTLRPSTIRHVHCIGRFAQQGLTNLRRAQVGAHFAQSALQRVARVDVHEYRHLASEQNLTGLPTFVLFPRGTLHRVRPSPPSWASAAFESVPPHTLQEHGLRFRGARSSRALIEFVASPAVYLLEAEVAARGAECMDSLLARGLVHFASEELNNSQQAQAVVDAAHRCALCRRTLTSRVLTRPYSAATALAWADALEALLCVAATPALRRTGIGSSPALWHMLDNAKLNYERAALQRIGLAREEAAEDAGAASPESAAETSHDAPDDPWELFDALAAKHAASLNERGVLADEL